MTDRIQEIRESIENQDRRMAVFQQEQRVDRYAFPILTREYEALRADIAWLLAELDGFERNRTKLLEAMRRDVAGYSEVVELRQEVSELRVEAAKGRADLCWATKLRFDAESKRDALQRHYDEAGGEHNLLALLDLYHDRKMQAERDRDSARDLAEQRGEQLVRMRDEKDAALALAESRPEISAEDAAAFLRENRYATSSPAWLAVREPLRAHAAKAQKGNADV